MITIASLAKSQKCCVSKQQGAPEVDIDVFSGDPLKYQYILHGNIQGNSLEENRPQGETYKVNQIYQW